MAKKTNTGAELTDKIISCAQQVHKGLGCGFESGIYRAALAIEMTNNGLSFCVDDDLEMLYKGHPVDTRHVDFFVEEKVVVDIQAEPRLLPLENIPPAYYLKAYHLEAELVLNFGCGRMEFRRIVRNRLRA